MFTVTVEDCGDCVNMNFSADQLLVSGEDCGCESMNVSISTTSVSCFNWTASGQNCLFEVRTISQDCGFTSDPVKKTLSLSSEFIFLMM